MRDLWETFINLDSNHEYEEVYDKVRYGIDVLFEIHDLWEETNQIVRKDKDRQVFIHGNVYTLSDFRSEKEERRRLMCKMILNSIEEDVIIAR